MRAKSPKYLAAAEPRVRLKALEDIGFWLLSYAMWAIFEALWHQYLRKGYFFIQAKQHNQESGVWEHLWEKVWNNLKCLKRCAFQCIKSLKMEFCEEQKKFEIREKSEVSHPWGIQKYVRKWAERASWIIIVYSNHWRTGGGLGALAPQIKLNHHGLFSIPHI